MNIPISRRLLVSLTSAGFALAFSASTLRAGPFILAGTDADDHGSFSAGANQDGWFFMQRALENLAPNVTNGNKVVAFLGTTPSTVAGNAAQSAFSQFALSAAGAGWTSVFYQDAALNTFLSGGLTGAGIVMMDSFNNVTGGASATEVGMFTTHATKIDAFLDAGGGLFSQSNGYGWVNALVPGLVVVTESAQGLALTPAGTAAFPGLNNGDLSAGPWHNSFSNVGTLPILATSSVSGSTFGHAVILGAAAGSVTNPTVPDAGSFLPIYLGLAGLGFAFRRRIVC